MTLVKAREAAAAVRFDADYPVENTARGDAYLFKDSLLRSGLVIDENITPGIDKKLKQVCKNLAVPEDCVNAFVYADPNIQASSVSLSKEECVLQFSSALLNQLDEEEIAFVMGHELGHFVLEHVGMHENDMAAESFVKNRAQEISADRLGLLGCGDLNASLRAMIKTVSGLESRMLKFDVGQFLSQVNQLASPSTGEAFHNTHPSILIRARALLWFSSTNIHNTFPAEINDDLVEDADKKVQQDLDKYVDVGFKKRVDEVKSDIVMWLAARKILDDGVFDDAEKDKFAGLFGNQMLDKLALFIEEHELAKARSHAAEKLDTARFELEKLIPHSFEKTYVNLQAKVQNFF